MVTPPGVTRDSTSSSALSRTAFWEEPCPLANDHGVGEQGDLIDQVMSEQPADEGAAAVHLQLAVWLGFQLADGCCNVA